MASAIRSSFLNYPISVASQAFSTIGSEVRSAALKVKTCAVICFSHLQFEDGLLIKWVERKLQPISQWLGNPHATLSDYWVLGSVAGLGILTAGMVLLIPCVLFSVSTPIVIDAVLVMIIGGSIIYLASTALIGIVIIPVLGERIVKSIVFSIKRAKELYDSNIVSRCFEWCNEARGSAEYGYRLEATERIVEAFLYRGGMFEVCFFSSLHLTSIPPTSVLSDLAQRGIRIFDFSPNNFTGLPLEIFDLPHTCTINISGCPFSTAVLESIRERTNAAGYNGPRISHSVFQPRVAASNTTLPQAVSYLYSILNQPPEDLPKLKKHAKANDLRMWLNRLAYISEFSKGGEKARKLAETIVENLRLAEHDENFRELFFETIEGAAVTCGDRMALSVIHLGIQKRLATVDLNDLKKVSELLIRGVWTIDQLEKIAREKIATLPFFDEIEVYLGYLVPLREKLQLPLDVKEMLFFGCSNLKPKDLEAAYKAVSHTLQDQNAMAEFLVSQPVWRKALERCHPEKYTAAVEAEDPHQALINLTFLSTD